MRYKYTIFSKGSPWFLLEIVSLSNSLPPLLEKITVLRFFCGQVFSSAKHPANMI